MSILRRLRPLLCRHDYFWSERHLRERCRRCGRFRSPDPDEEEYPLLARSRQRARCGRCGQPPMTTSGMGFVDPGMVPAAGIEPATSSLQNWRSTN